MKKLPRFIYITGCDGTGKSTQAKLLVEKLKEQGITPIHLWLRFPFFLSLPLLVYARYKKISWYEEHDGGVKHGYWSFNNSWVMREIFPWLFLVDASIASLLRVYLPIFLGRTIVCERYIIDMLADIEVGLDDRNFHKRLIGRLFVRLLPRDTRVIFLDLDKAFIQDRRSDLLSDKMLTKRLETFRRIYQEFEYSYIWNTESIEAIHNRILRTVENS